MNEDRSKTSEDELYQENIPEEFQVDPDEDKLCIFYSRKKLLFAIFLMPLVFGLMMFCYWRPNYSAERGLHFLRSHESMIVSGIIFGIGSVVVIFHMTWNYLKFSTEVGIILTRKKNYCEPT